jgi:NADPH-dependent 2,4-dienoyl-CoA reductase/sulfur reductase-like enzyme
VSGEILVIGAGPAGLAAAQTAASYGARVTLIDDNRQAGGQYYRHPASEALRAVRDDLFDEAARGAELLAVPAGPNVAHHPGSVFYGFFDDGVAAFVHEDRIKRMVPGATVVATGATERPLPFPGWTLPGVMGAGAVQNLLKSQRTLPGRRVLVTGNGPLTLLAAANLVRCGAEVVEVLEAAANRPPLAMIPRLFLEPEMLLRGIGYRALLMRHGVPFRSRHVIVEAGGSARVETATVAPVDDRGRPDLSRARTLAVDTVVAGFGLVPASEITRSIGCEHVHDPGKGGWIPVRNADLETSRPGVFAAGECAGAAGVEKALLEGELAGLAAAMRVGAAAGPRAEIHRDRLRRRLRRLMAFRIAIEAIYHLPSPPLLARDDTVICRCEEVTLAEARRWAREGVTEANSLKAVTRMSMGRCQGRNCLPTVARLIAAETGTEIAEVSLPRPRPPLKPVSVGAWLAEP